MTLFSSGCGLFYKNPPEHALWSKLGVDSYHFESCGPEALRRVHKNFGKDIGGIIGDLMAVSEPLMVMVVGMFGL